MSRSRSSSSSSCSSSSSSSSSSRRKVFALLISSCLLVYYQLTFTEAFVVVPATARKNCRPTKTKSSWRSSSSSSSSSQLLQLQLHGSIKPTQEEEEKTTQFQQRQNSRSDTASSAASSKTNTDEERDTDDDEMMIWGYIPQQTVLNPLALLLASQFVLFIGVGAVIPSIPLYGKEIGLSGAANGIVISAPAVALLALANTSGNLADQARKPAMIGGMALIVVSDIGTALATSLPTLVLARLGLGAGRGISEAGERGMLADLANKVPALRGRALASQQAVIALGIAIGAPLGGIIVEKYGPRAAFLCVSAAAFCALLSYFFLPETTTMTTTSTTTTSTSTGDTEKEEMASTDDNNNNKQNKNIVEWTTLLQDDQWKGLALCQCGASFGFAAKISSIPILASATLPGGAIGAGALLSAAGLSGLVGAPVGGWITDQAGAKFAAIVSGIVSGIALIGIPLALSSTTNLNNTPAWIDDWMASHTTTAMVDLNGNAMAFCLFVIVWSMAVAAQGPAMTALAQQLAPKGSEATSLALPKAAGDGTYIVAPFLLGLVADQTTPHLVGVECAVAGCATLLGSIALTILGGGGGTGAREKEQKREEEDQQQHKQ